MLECGRRKSDEVVTTVMILVQGYQLALLIGRSLGYGHDVFSFHVMLRLAR
jgi:hypothetical protein